MSTQISHPTSASSHRLTEPLSVAAVAVGLAAHVSVLAVGLPSVPEFRSEWITVLAASGSTAVVAFLSGTLLLLRVAQVLRLGFALICLNMIGDSFVVVALLLTLPILLDAALYDETVPGIISGALSLAAAAALGFARFGGAGFLARGIAFLVAGGTLAAVSLLMVHWREAVVEERRHVQNLNSAVLSLSDANKAFQTYAGMVESTSATRERQRITRELHDVAGYTLTNVIVMMDACRVLRRQDPERLDEIFTQIRGQAESALAETRKILHRLREVRDGRPEGLRAVHQMVRAFSGATGISVRLNLGNVPWSLGPRLDATILRLVQEGLTNAFRHGKATQIRINMWRLQEEISISIWDNGRGVDTAIKEGIGFTGMRERFKEIGGSIRPHNVPDGFQLDARIPFVEAGTPAGSINE